MVKVQSLRRRQESISKTYPQQMEHRLGRIANNGICKVTQKKDILPRKVKSPRKESGLSPQLTSSQVSTIYPSLSEELVFVDVETGSSFADSTESRLISPRSIQSLPTSSDMKHLILTSRENEPDISATSSSPRNAETSFQLELQPMSNALISHASDLSTSECSTNTHISRVDADNKCALSFEPFDPRTWPVFLIPLAVVPCVGLVVLVMVAILVGIIIKTYLSSEGAEGHRD